MTLTRSKTDPPFEFVYHLGFREYGCNLGMHEGTRPDCGLTWVRFGDREQLVAVNDLVPATDVRAVGKA